jgi:hypothetical protein
VWGWGLGRARARAGRAGRRARGERSRIVGQGELVRERAWHAGEPLVAMTATAAAWFRGGGRHLLIVGATGSGKTVSARRWLLARIVADGVAVLATDPKGRHGSRAGSARRSALGRSAAGGLRPPRPRQ